MSDINIGQITEALNDKADRDMMNVDTLSGADAVVEYQEPTSANDYTWYRKYASGWVEQGGQTASEKQSTTHAIVFPVEMADANYFVCITQTVAGNGYIIRATGRTTTGFNMVPDYFTAGANPSGVKLWQVSGLSAN